MAQPSEGELRRVIGFWGGLAIVVGVTIGAGIFRKPGTIAGDLKDPAWTLVLWAGFGAVSLCGALAIAELASMLPRSGGLYVYLREAYGDAAAFVFGWLYWLVTTPAGLGALATFFAELVLGKEARHGERKALAIGTVLLFAIANVRGVRLGSGINGTLTAIKVAAVLAIISSAFLLGSGTLRNLGGGAGTTSAGLATAAASILWTYDGWIGATFVAGEIKDPERSLQRILISGIVGVSVLYVATNAAYFYLFPVEDLAREKVAAVSLMSNLFGRGGGTAISLGIMASVAGAINGNILTKSRVVFAQARDGLSFRFLGLCHPRWGTPFAAIAGQALAAAGLILWLEEFDPLTDYFVVVEWAALLFAIGAVFVLRRSRPDAPRPFRTPLYPIVPILFLAGALLGLGAILWGYLQKDARWDQKFAPFIGLGISLAGFPIYFIWRRSVPGSAGRATRPGEASPP